MLNQRQSVAPAPETEEHRTPRLAFYALRATINQPLPLGIVLNIVPAKRLWFSMASSKAQVSPPGTPLSATCWSLPGHDLDKAFISAPENFDGTMQVTVTLDSSRQDILETKEIRFEWGGSEEGG